MHCIQIRRVSGSPLAGLAALCVLVALGLGPGCSGADAERPPNVLLVVIDTLRADKLGCYGNDAGLSPNIDALAAEGVLFEDVTNHAPWTLPAMASLLTSLYPKQHGAGGHLPDALTGLEPGLATLASVFDEAGYATASIVNVAFLGKQFGLTKGFDEVDAEYYENNREVRTAEETSAAGVEWLEKRPDRPFFLMVHYFDPHAVYAPPQPYRRQFCGPLDREDESFVFGTRQHMMQLRSGKLELKPGLIRRAERLYDAEIAYTDHAIGQLLHGLSRLGLDENTLVVFTTDHGEEFLDHDGFEHGHSVYDEVIRVPLVLRLPGVLEPRRIDGKVGHVDVAPTVLELVGVPAPDQFCGRSLVGLMSAGELENWPQLAHGNFWGAPKTSFSSGDYKLILSGAAAAGKASEEPGEVELYSRTQDPREANDLAADETEIVRRMREDLQRFEEAMQGRFHSSGQVVELTDAMRKELAGHGYTEGLDEDETDATDGDED